jgi:hypothetical protein
MTQPNATAYRWQARGEVMIVTRSNVDRFCFDKAMQLDPDWLVPLEIAQSYLHHGYPSQALGRARQAIERGADQPFPWYFLGLCQRELDLNEAAARSFHRVLDIVPNHGDAQRHLTELNQLGFSPFRLLRRLFRLR